MLKQFNIMKKKQIVITNEDNVVDVEQLWGFGVVTSPINHNLIKYMTENLN